MTTFPDPDEQVELSKLVFRAIDRHETTTMTRLAEIAQNAGHQITHTMLSQIRLRRYNHRLKTPAVEALAFLSGVPKEQVSEMAGRGPTLGPFAQQLPDEIDILQGPARSALIKIMSVMIDLEREARLQDQES